MTTYTVRVTGYDDDGAPCASTFTVEARDRADAANEALAAARDCGWQDCNTGRIEEQQPTAAERIRAARADSYRAQIRETFQRMSPRALAHQDSVIVGGIDREELERELRRRAAAPIAAAVLEHARRRRVVLLHGEGLEERAQLADRIGDEGSPRYCPTCGADVLGNDPHASDCPKLER